MEFIFIRGKLSRRDWRSLFRDEIIQESRDRLRSQGAMKISFPYSLIPISHSPGA
ncbi:MAG: hypothetical protein V7K77_02715 [Nostoc sp.]|uniref:hypothetical protein n=1 Tax=Nostoc sp. TaxID=1180 RepID=UPI002FF8B60A